MLCICVSLIRPWLLPGLTGREREERSWLHTTHSARKPGNGRANAGQVIWRLGCIKAIYKRLKDLRRFTHWVCTFMWPGNGLLCFFRPSQSILKGNKQCCLYGCLAFCLVARVRRFYGWLLTPGVKANTWDYRVSLHSVSPSHTHTGFSVWWALHISILPFTPTITITNTWLILKPYQISNLVLIIIFSPNRLSSIKFSGEL